MVAAVKTFLVVCLTASTLRGAHGTSGAWSTKVNWDCVSYAPIGRRPRGHGAGFDTGVESASVT